VRRQPRSLADLTLVNIAAALKGRHAALGHVSSGLFPLDMETSTDGPIIAAASFGSSEVELVPTTGVLWPASRSRCGVDETLHRFVPTASSLVNEGVGDASGLDQSEPGVESPLLELDVQLRPASPSRRRMIRRRPE
jgi:hypothetical protein